MSHETPQQAARRISARQINRGFKPAALHVYCDAGGNPLYWRIRLKHPQTREKWLRPIHINGQQMFVMGEPEFKSGKPLYRLDQITSNPDETVWVTEGEWCADHLNKLGILATTSGGAESAHSADWSVLANRKVIIWPDNDEVGKRYATEVTEQLQKCACAVLWVDVAQLALPEKADCVDWLQVNPNATKQEIVQLPLIPPAVKKEIPETFKPRQNLPAPFSINDKGVFYVDEKDIYRICSKLEVKALVRDKQSENWGRLLEFFDADSQLHGWAMPMEMLKGSGEELRGELLRLGLEIASGTRARNLLIEYITTTKPEARARCVTHTGWYNNSFVLPQGTIGDANELVIYQSENHLGNYAQSNTLQQWQQHIARYCVGNSRLALAVACAFASMLLYPGGMESGGIHLVGESSTGKTTALRVAASVFGGMDYLHRWRATANGLEAIAALRSDTLLILDELAQVEAKEAGEIAYMLANGSGKARATKNGSVRARYEWRLLFLSAGEIGLAQHIREAGKKAKAGQEVRLIDVPADAGSNLGIFETLHGFSTGAELSKVLNAAAAQYYGTAAIAFLKLITKSDYFAILPNTIKMLCEDFIKKYLPPKSGGQVYRVCERFALIAAAGELATDLEITGWESGIAENAVVSCFKAWLDYRGGTDNQERTSLLAQVQAFFEAHGVSRFEDFNVMSEQHINNRVGFKRKGGAKNEYFVLPEMFRREICHGYDPRWAARLLVDVGMLKPGSEGKPQSVHRLPGEGLRKCYHFVNTEV